MPARGSVVSVAAWLVFFISYAGAQTNPHTAVPAPQQSGPVMRPGVQRGPGNPQAMRIPMQTGPAAVVPQKPSAAAPQKPVAQATTAPVNPAQPSPQAAEVPQRPAEMPAKPPRVSYVGGELTVVADNSMLNDVLNGIRSAAGIKLEGLSGSNDRVFGQFGPASPRVVIDSLLSGSHYDFIILSALDTPDTVQRVILSPRSASPTGAMAAANQGRSFGRPPVQEDNDVAGNSDQVSEEQPVGVTPGQGIQPGQPIQVGQPIQPAPVQPGQPGAVNATTVPNQNQQQSGAQTVKTPEQLLEELRRLNNSQRQNQGNTEGPRAPMQPNQPPDIVPR